MANGPFVFSQFGEFLESPVYHFINEFQTEDAGADLSACRCWSRYSFDADSFDLHRGC